MKISLPTDRENWRVEVAEEMEVGTASDGSQRMLKLTRDTGEQRTSVGETARDRNGDSIQGSSVGLNTSKSSLSGCALIWFLCVITYEALVVVT